jgi:hypothetical protein
MIVNFYAAFENIRMSVIVLKIYSVWDVMIQCFNYLIYYFAPLFLVHGVSIGH